MQPDAVLAAVGKLRGVNIEPLGFNGEPVNEPVVIGWMPAISLYFKDPDGHSIEFLAMLDTTPNPDFGVAPYSAWIAKTDSP
jgi:lactoylglutathione lyase